MTYGPSLFQVNAVATGSDESAVYAASADYAAVQSAIFKSADGGRPGIRSSMRTRGEYYSDILVDPASPATIYAGALGNDGATRLYRPGRRRQLDGSLGQTILPTACPPSPGHAAGAALVSCGTQLSARPTRA